MSKIEVIVLNDEDAKIAEAYGADRLELVTAIGEGGLTPSYGAIKRVVNSVKIPVMIMLRPHNYSFTYQKEEWDMIREDIRIIRELGAEGIVFGALTEEKLVDFDILAMVLEEADSLSITFHRAIDESKPLEIYRSLCESPHKINQVLTSGGKPTVMQGLEGLRNLVKDSMRDNDKPVIMPGSGLDINNIKFIHQTLQAQQYHFGSGVRKEGDFRQSIDRKILQKIKGIVYSQA
ncbi:MULTISPECIES: copper homeostasis protein CutC [Metabacillus]|jgi:copper homeostasis protein|uniref:PF03932 family protein CutC n=1 Tax=Metabacillus rhizolycopersici TaxID=2875709 RepID=A0ABS7UZY7_9BACI|nr:MULTISPECIES: copper homeostasis protein CutC [Metabacillus]MBZ5753877.1 copper homeostasis protein CutC [Metabacillus rhizolycopersici]MCM3653703.1 copper homeostasis protein CutC [Metabacillus litoralis]